VNIIIDHGGYAVSNMGDLSMLQVAVKRFSEQYPEAKIYVFTTAPEKLKRACPNVETLSVEARSIWF
jgi:ADP-heptose:LPS heptosyltransferase